MVAFFTNEPSTHLIAERRSSGLLNFAPAGVVRCLGSPVFRTRSARDLGCLLDVDQTVDSWECLPIALYRDTEFHILDFAVTTADGTFLIDAAAAPSWVPAAAKETGYDYRSADFLRAGACVRLLNAKDLLRYARYPVVLGDRISLLAFLDEWGPMPLASCFEVVRHARDKMGVVASLVLDRILEMDLDEAPIGPETRISRFHC